MALSWAVISTCPRHWSSSASVLSFPHHLCIKLSLVAAAAALESSELVIIQQEKRRFRNRPFPNRYGDLNHHLSLPNSTCPILPLKFPLHLKRVPKEMRMRKKERNHGIAWGGSISWGLSLVMLTHTLRDITNTFTGLTYQRDLTLTCLHNRDTHVWRHIRCMHTYYSYK